VLLINTGHDGAIHIAEKIRKCAEDMEIPCHDGLAANITVSIGVNTWTHGVTYTVDEFIIRADSALFSAKSTGKNRVCHFIGNLLHT